MIPIIICCICLFCLFTGLYKSALFFGLCVVIPGIYYLLQYKRFTKQLSAMTHEDKKKYYISMPKRIKPKVKVNDLESRKDGGYIIYSDISSWN